MMTGTDRNRPPRRESPEESDKMNRQQHYEALTESSPSWYNESVAPPKLSRSDILKMKHDLLLCRTFINESLEVLEVGLKSKNVCKNC